MPLTIKQLKSELMAAHNREKDWRAKARKIQDRHSDGAEKGSAARFNILWSNTEILRAALKPRNISPDVRRRFAVRDKVGRQAAMVQERSLAFIVDSENMATQVEHSIMDFLLPGRGTVRVHMDPVIEGEGDDEEVTDVDIYPEFVNWEDYREGRAKTWKDVPWVAYRHSWTKEDFKNANLDVEKLNFDTIFGPDDEGQPDTEGEIKTADVWEFWYKPDRVRYWFSEDHTEILRTDDDPYQLREFFPQADNIFAVPRNKSRVPSPVYLQYEDQAVELDEITARLRNLVNQARWRGAFDASQDPDGKLENFANAGDGTFIPVENWASFSQAGGLNGVFQEQDLQGIVNAIQVLSSERSAKIQAIYELTGISDIIRGATDPNETKGAQQLKAKFGSMRMTNPEEAVSQLIRDTLRIVAELVAEHMPQEKLEEMTQVDMPTRAESQARLVQAQQQAFMGTAQVPPEQLQQYMAQAQQGLQQLSAEISETVHWEDVMEVLQDDDQRSFKVDVETTDSALEESEEDKKQKLELYGMISKVVGETLPIAMSNPAALGFVKELTMLTLQGFKVGRAVEESLEDMFDQLGNNQQQPQPNPDLEKLKAEMAAKLEEHKLELQKIQAEMARDREMHRLEIEGQELENEGKLIDLEIRRNQGTQPDG